MIFTLHDGRKVSIEHLAPTVIECPCKEIGRSLRIRVAYSNHCYTEAFVEGQHDEAEILFRDAADRGRVFCPIRYELSKQLPELIAALPTKRVNQTTQVRNYVYVAQLNVSNRVYEIYFMLQRAAGDKEVDLRLTIESAYPREVPSVLPKKPNNIRFFILARKVLMNQSVRFAPR